MTYQKTHPWLTFRLDFNTFDYKLWSMLGEAKAKCEQIASMPLQPGVSKYLYQVYLARGILATTAIEGNTLSEQQVMDIIEGDLELPKSKAYLEQEVRNILDASNLIADGIMKENRSPHVTPEDLLEYNEMILRDLEVEDGVVPGTIKTSENGVPGYRGAPAKDCEYLVERLCEWLKTWKSEGANDVMFDIVKSIVAHVYLVWIHPYGDGNGRTARLMEVLILISAGLPKPTCQLLSNHYNQTRSEYYRQLSRASKNGGDLRPFLAYAVQGLVDQLNEQLDFIHDETLQVSWEHYIHQEFKDKSRKIDARRRRLALDISRAEDPVPSRKAKVLTPRLAEEYSSLTQRAVQRDLEELASMGMIRPAQEGWVTCREKVLGFLPPRLETTEVEETADE